VILSIIPLDAARENVFLKTTLIIKKFAQVGLLGV
jgi:hypothetical protein